MRRYLNEASGFWQVQTGVTNLGEKDCVDGVVVLEVLQNAETLLLRRCTVDVSFAELLRILLQCIDVVGEDDDLVASRFVIVDEELTCLELSRVHDG
jgi:hypothetical protein